MDRSQMKTMGHGRRSRQGPNGPLCAPRGVWWLRAAAGGAGLTLLAGGCMTRSYSEPLMAAAEDPRTSPAWVHRQFAPTSAVYENTATVAWSTRFPWVVRPDPPDVVRPVVEPAIFLGNVLVLPVSVVLEPPLWRQHAWRPVGLEPTATAAVAPEEVVPVTAGALVPAWRPDVWGDQVGRESVRYGKFPRRQPAAVAPTRQVQPSGVSVLPDKPSKEGAMTPSDPEAGGQP